MKELIQEITGKEVILKAALLLAAWLLGMAALNRLFALISRRNGAIHMKFLHSVSRVLWTMTALIAASSFFSATRALSATLLTSSSLLVAVVGFAAQQVLADIISGVMLSWSRPFNIGEKITLTSEGITGYVEDMTVRHTVIRTFHNSRLIIPNSVINKAVIENSNYENSFIGNYLEVAISYASDLELAIRLMRDTIESHPLVIDPRADKTAGYKANVLVKDLSGDGPVLKATVCTKDINDNFMACSDIRRSLKEVFDREGVVFSYRRIGAQEEKNA